EEPNSGRIGRSPGEVARMRRMLSSISRSSETSAMRPVASVRSGKAQPVPMNSRPIASPLVDLHHGAADGRDAGGRELGGAGSLDLGRRGLDRGAGLPLDVDLRALEGE